jgi:predicted choloylglycine hydrolase
MIAFIAYYLIITHIDEPKIDLSLIKKGDLIKHNDTCYSYQDSWLRKNRFGLWEMYISGSPEELGIKNGILAQSLIKKQEEAFVAQIKRMIPSESYLKFLKYITSYMNRDLPDYIPKDYLTEIKAVSIFASDKFDFIGENYIRQLNYHAAHDIGHAMQNLHLVECTAFGVWNTRSADSSLLLGRNFDFYVGDEFAKNKIILFVKPDHGYPFVSITWGGMIGVVSGMNMQGLSITLNSAKGEIPMNAKTPVSIIAREILQYAANIDEAYTIAKSHPSFVAESFMIGSANDNKVAIIEKTPDTTILYYTTDHHIVLTNHFQSDALKSSQINVENMEENVTKYRFDRVEELLAKQDMFDEFSFAKMLRDTKGLNDEDIGLGNEGAINQLIAHHSTIFKPEQKKFWISSAPFQLGAYPAYSLDSIFGKSNQAISKHDLANELISADTVFLKEYYPQFLKFKSMILQVKNDEEIDIDEFIKTNTNYFYTYEIIGDYYSQRQNQEKASLYYNKALQKFIPNLHEQKRIEEKLEKMLSKTTK